MAKFHSPLCDFVFEQNDLPDGWEWFEAKVLDHKGRDPKDWRFTQYCGAVFPHLLTRGPRKGLPNFKRPEPGTERVVVVDDMAYRQWLPRWEAQTGQCYRCCGEGVVTVSWSSETGRRTRPCKRCNGTGVAQAGEAGTAETQSGSVHEHAVGEADAPTNHSEGEAGQA